MEGRGRQKENRFDLQVFHSIKILSVCEEMVVDTVGPSVCQTYTTYHTRLLVCQSKELQTHADTVRGG